jgi:hypothetical protein
MNFIQDSVLHTGGDKPMTEDEIKALLLHLFEAAGMPATLNCAQTHSVK